AEYAVHTGAAADHSLRERHHPAGRDPIPLRFGLSGNHWSFFFRCGRFAGSGFALVRLGGLAWLGLRRGLVSLGHGQAGIVLLDAAPLEEIDGLLQLVVVGAAELEHLGLGLVVVGFGLAGFLFGHIAV